MMDRLWRAVTGAVTRGRVISAAQRGGRVLADVSMLDGETRTRVELLLPYGLSAVPRAGADVVVLEVGGDRSHLVALSADESDLRIEDLAAGEIGLRDHQGQRVVIRGDGVEVRGALKVTIVSSGDVSVEAPRVIVDSPEIHLGGTGGQAVVRHGDSDSAGHTMIATTTKVFAT